MTLRLGPDDDAQPVDFATVTPHKRHILERAFDTFCGKSAARNVADEFREFCQRHVDWLDPYAYYMALSDLHQTPEWIHWPSSSLSARQVLASYGSGASPMPARLERAVQFHRFTQFMFDRQWQSLRTHAHRLGIWIVGDMPIYVAHASCDVWANPELFDLDDLGAPRRVAGVPPDYFSDTGQLWSNPLYDWPAMQRTGFAWWIQRLRAVLDQTDLVRLDHFRGLQAYWAVPAHETTAVHGEWLPGPGADLLETLQQAWLQWDRPLPLLQAALPLIAEDLGVITPDVVQLRRKFSLPGMSVLQFAFTPDAAEDRFLPTNIDEDTVVYTGTHDNDTTVGWYQAEIARDPKLREQLQRYLPGNSSDIAWQMIELAWQSRGFLAIAPLQDVLSLDSEFRMNTPGTETGNWRWRFPLACLTDELQQRLAEATQRAGRTGGSSVL